MSIARLHPAQPKLFEHGRRIEAQACADLLQRLAGGVVLNSFVDLRLTHTPWPLAYTCSIQVLADRHAVDAILRGQLMDRNTP